MTEQLLSTAELARRLSLSERTIRDLARHGRIPCFRVSRNRVRFDWAAVLRALGREAKEPVHIGVITREVLADLERSQTEEGGDR